MKQTRCVYAAGCCSAIRKKETMPFAATWMSLAIFVLSKVDHSSYTWRTCIYLKSVELSIHTNYLTLSLFYMFIHFCSLAQSCPTLCDPMNRSTPGFPAHHQLPEFTQTHVHSVSDTIQPSHPLSSFLLLPSIFPSIRVFKMSQLFTSGGQNIGVSASTSQLPMNT